MRAALLTTEMTEEFRVRRLRPEDDVQLEALYARTRNPYREEDAGAVAAMHCLALQARETGCRWSALPAEARNASEAEHRAFWVAVPLANGMLEIIGTVGLRIVGDSRSADADTVESSGLPSAEKWTQTADVGEVRRLRVLPEWRRRGVATALMSELISWSATAGLRGAAAQHDRCATAGVGALPQSRLSRNRAVISRRVRTRVDAPAALMSSGC